MASLIRDSASQVFTAERLKTAAKQSESIHLVSLRLRRAIKRFLRDQEKTHMNRKVLRLSESFCGIKEANLQICANTSKELVEDPLKSMEQSKRWKIKSSYGDIGLKYRDDETIAYVASRMPAVYSACHRVLRESYVLGEIPSLRDRITVIRQLWDLTRDILVLVEPGTPQGSSIIAQMRSHVLWMEKRKCRKVDSSTSETSGKAQSSADNIVASKNGAFVVAPCPHDGACPLEKSAKYCHFVQRLERTSSQRAYKRSKGEPLRGFEDEKFCYVAIRKGERPRKPWPLDGMKFETLKEQHAKRNPEDLEIDFEDQFVSDDEDIPFQEENCALYVSDITETDAMDEQEEVEEEEGPSADLGSGWGRIIFTPVRRGRHVSLDICRSTKRDGSEGAFERVVVTQHKNPTLHHQARRSLWGDLWPF